MQLLLWNGEAVHEVVPIRNKVGGRAYWVTMGQHGTLSSSVVNLDKGVCTLEAAFKNSLLWLRV